jgi:DHA2 family multidrug resistance protein
MAPGNSQRCLSAGKRGQAFALDGVTAVLAPTIGPRLGGWITDNYSWRRIFFINLPESVLAVYLTWILVEDPPLLHRLKNAGTTLASLC